MTLSLSVAVVGSGPSGAYCARLLSQDGSLDARVDVYERLPAPYGLLRYGVAPDHPKIKSIAACSPRCGAWRSVSPATDRA